MRDQEDASVVGVGGMPELAQDLAGEGHVESGRRLVCDEQARGAPGRQGDHDALGHPARELVRIGPQALLRRPDADGSEDLAG